jgi:hypothetical protein
MCKSILKAGSYIDFDDYDWRILGSSLDPAKIPEIAEIYSAEQISDFQVARIVNQFVRSDLDFFEVVEKKIFRYLSNDSCKNFETAMSEKELKCLLKFLRKSKIYFEFGSGHSTLMASQFLKLKVISFETDQYYIPFMKTQIEGSEKALIDFVHLDVGPTSDWGWPRDTTKLSNYLPSLLNQIGTLNLRPDLVLIDGRFRVATFLACCTFAPGAVILFDDYVERDNYHVIESIIKPKKFVGRIGIFQVPKRLKRKKHYALIKMLGKFIYDPS